MQAYQCDKAKAAFLLPLPLIINIRTKTTVSSDNPGVTIQQSSDGANTVITHGGTSKITITTETIDDTYAKPEELAEFLAWAQQQDIAILGIDKSYSELKKSDLNLPQDSVEITKIQLVMNASKGLRLLPQQVLDYMRGKVVYISTVDDSTNYAVYIHGSSEGLSEIGTSGKTKVKSGIFLVAPVSDFATVHEVGHIVGTLGIEGKYGADNTKYKFLLPMYNQLFFVPAGQNTPCGYISEYSTKNHAENFADHFAFYVFDGSGFRDRAETDGLLKAKYDFLKEHIFFGKEY